MFSQNHKKFIYLIFGLIIVISVFLLFGDSLKREQPSESLNKFSGISAKVAVETIDNTTLPELLPKNLPLEEGVEIQRNEIVRVLNSKETQYVRKYVSKLTVDENIEIYNKYLKDNSWKIKTALVEPGKSAGILAEKQDQAGLLQISIAKNEITSEVTVELVIVTR
ncbi:MAG: hypothetical protein AAB410_04035 [Patescibacteria group bacterium]